MNPRKLCLAAFGVILGIAGIEHGIGEIVQGSTLITTHFIKSWPDNRFYEILAGEPAFSLFINIPFYLLGVLAILFSSSLIICSIFFIDKKYGALCFFILNLCLFLFGSGMAGPVIIGIPVSIAALIMKKKIISGIKYRSKIKYTFYFFFLVSIAGWFTMWPGFVILGMINKIPAGSNNIVYFTAGISFFTFIISLILSFLFDGIIPDIKRKQLKLPGK